MNNISITISTRDNRTQAFGYDPKFYENENARNIDITNDLAHAKERFEDQVAIVSVAEWDDDVENSNGIVYQNIDEVLEVYKPKIAVEPEE